MKPRTKMGTACVGVALLASVTPLQAQNQVQLVGQNLQMQQSASPATLQVTGTSQSFNLLVGRADVQDILKAVFEQGLKQFTLDAGITGQVTLRLVNQPLKTVLDTICRQTFLKYQIQSGVFVFSRDEDAVRRAITQLNALNTQLRDQLRLMGLDMPPEANFYAQNGMQGRSGFNGGGLGGGGGTTNAPNSRNGVYPNGDLRRLQVPPGLAQDLIKMQNSGGRGGGATASKSDTSKSGNSGAGYGRGRDNTKAEPLLKPDGLAANTPGNALGGNGDTAYNTDPYSLLLKENGLYGVNTQGAQVPVSDILTELGRQSGVTVLLDPDIPKDTRFRMRAKLPPRTFEETLNFIATGAHLELRRAGNTVIVSPTPEFQLFFGTETQPRVSYPNVQNSQRAKLQEPADSKDVKKEASDKKQPVPEKPKEEKVKGKGKEPR